MGRSQAKGARDDLSLPKRIPNAITPETLDAELHPVGRMAEIRDFVDAILFLENAPYIDWPNPARRPMATRTLPEWSDGLGRCSSSQRSTTSQQETYDADRQHTDHAGGDASGVHARDGRTEGTPDRGRQQASSRRLKQAHELDVRGHRRIRHRELGMGRSSRRGTPKANGRLGPSSRYDRTREHREGMSRRLIPLSHGGYRSRRRRFGSS